MKCEEHDWAVVTPVYHSSKGRDLLLKHKELIGKYVCYNCHKIIDQEPSNYVVVTGETVLRNLFSDKGD